MIASIIPAPASEINAVFVIEEYYFWSCVVLSLLTYHLKYNILYVLIFWGFAIRNNFICLWILFLSFILLTGCGNREEVSYAGFLELPDIQNIVKELYDVLIVKTEAEDALLEKGYTEEQIKSLRETDLDTELKRLATYPAERLGTSVYDSVMFKQ